MTSRRRLTLAEQAYEELRQKIVSGRLPAGRRLLPEELADELSISPTPVKEALSRLEQDGLVEGESRRASMVRRFSRTDIRNIYASRLLLELHSVSEGMAAGRATPAFVDRLAGLFDQYMRHVARKTLKGLTEAIRIDCAFHEVLVSLGDNDLIAMWHRTVIRQSNTIRNYSPEQYNVARAGSEHAAIVDAVRAGDLDALTSVLRFHILASRDEILARTPEDPPAGPGLP